MAPQHSTSNVGGDTFRDNSENKTNLLIESWLLRISLLCQNGVVHFKFTKKQKQFQWSHFIKLQSNHISARLALTCGCMANGSHAVRMDPHF